MRRKRIIRQMISIERYIADRIPRLSTNFVTIFSNVVDCRKEATGGRLESRAAGRAKSLVKPPGPAGNPVPTPASQLARTIRHEDRDP